jgi:hypothetical protein
MMRGETSGERGRGDGLFLPVQNVRVALAVAVAGAALFCSTGALAQTASGTGVETSAGEDMPDYPIPAKAREAYSPQGVDAVNPQTKAPLPNRDVLNLRLDYEPVLPENSIRPGFAS